MTPQEIIEGNQLIAEFMGYDDVDCPKCKHTRGCNWLQCGLTPHEKDEQLKYHSSWSWLMPVVKKCSESFEHHQYDSEEYYHITEEIFHPDYSLSEFMDADIEAVYSRVVTYIKWYNQNKEK